MFDPAHFMMDTLFDFMEFMAADNKISLMKLLKDAGNVIEKKPAEIQEANLTMIDVPIFYTILKELLQSQKIFALTQEKERVLVLQSSFTLEKVEPLLKNENIEFNFELKQLALETFENIYLKSAYQNTNIFEDYQHFAEFTSFLLTDVYGYLKANNYYTPNGGVFESNFFAGSEAFLAKYNNLLETKNINNVVFFQYQSLMQVRQLWKNYIYYLLCDFFGHLITHFKDFMLTRKEKGQQSENLFEIWLKLMTKIREIDPYPETRSRLNQALKNAVSHSEYVYKRDLVHSLLENNHILSVSFKRGLSKQKTHLKLHVDSILQRYLGDKTKLKTKYLESNLAKIAINLGLNKQVLKRLICVLSTQETSTKDVVFILRLFRSFIEVENKGNMVNKLPVYQWADVSEQEFRKIHEIQEVLADLGLVEAVFHLMYHHQNPEKTVFRELLLLCNAMLYGGNRVVQDEYYEEFRQDYDNEIMGNFAFILEDNLEIMRVRESERTEDAYFKALQHIFDNLEYARGLNGSESILDVPEELKKDLAIDFYEDESENSKPGDNDYDLLLIILKFLQNLCEGHHLNFQEFLRDQTLVEHSKSFNIPEFLRQAYHVYYKYHNIHNVETGVKILDLLIEIQQGESQENIDLMLKKTFINDLCSTLNGYNTNLDLLARGFSFDSSHPSLMEIKSKVLIILKDLVEKSEPSSLIKIAQYVDLKALVSTFKENIIAFHKKNGACPTKETMRIDDMWDPNLSCAFMVYFILKHLSFDEDSEDFTPEIQETMKEILENGQGGVDGKVANQYLHQFFKQYTGSIEILQKKTNKLMRIYYPVPPVCSYLKHETQADFANKVDRSNTLTKIADLMDSSVEIIGQMYVEYNSQKSLFGLNFNNLYASLRFFTNIISIFIVMFDIIRLDYKDGKVFFKGGEDDIAIKTLLCVIQSFLALMLTFLWTKISLPRHLAFKWDQFVSQNVHDMGELPQDYIQKLNKRELITPEIAEAVLLLKGPYSEEWDSVEFMMQDRLKKMNRSFTLESGMLIWHMMYFVICMGSSFHPIVAALQLFDITIRSDTVGRIAMAISRNLGQFLWTLVLLFVTVYIYSLVGLYFMNGRFQDGDVGDLCQDAYSCLLASLNYGLRSGGGIADAIQKFKYDEENKVQYLINTLFDLSFFIIIVTLLLNLIFGMIIDAFGDLRDEKSSNEEDMENVCFICGLQRSEYERTDNFERHISKEHNMWKYLAYLVYLQEKSKLYMTDFTDIEDYVLDRYRNKDYMWIPVGRSLTLERHLAKGEKEKKSEIEKMKADIDHKFDKLFEQTKYIINRMDEENHHHHGGRKQHGTHVVKSPNKHHHDGLSKQNSNTSAITKPPRSSIKNNGIGGGGGKS